MEHVKKGLSVWISAILAGMMISIGGTVFFRLSADGTLFGKVAGAVLFSIGLFTIVAFGFHLYTGKVGGLFLPGASYPAKLSELLMTLIGNLCGTCIAGLIFGSYLRANSGIVAAVNAKADMLTNSPMRLLAVSAGCGVLMFAAVLGYRFAKNEITKAVLVLFAVAGFILAGFEHSIADMFYVAASGVWTGKTIGMLSMVVLGNSLGGALMGLLWRLSKKLTGSEVG